MQELSRGADHGSDLRLHVSLYAGNCSEHVYTLLIGYRSGGTPGFPQNLRARDGIAGRRRGSSACQRPSNLPALRVARRYSPVGFGRQHDRHNPYNIILCHTGRSKKGQSQKLMEKSSDADPKVGERSSVSHPPSHRG